MGAIAVELPWIVWEQLESQTNLSDWSVRAFNQETGAELVLGTSRRADGGYLLGQQPIPAVKGGVAAWTQPVPDTTGAVKVELRLVDLSTRQESTLDTGQLSSPVFAGPYLIWARHDADGSYTLRAVESATHQSVALPDQLAHPGTIGYLAGSPEYLAWSDQNATGLTVWRIASGTYDRYTIQDHQHHFQFLTLAGHFLLWYTGTTSSILDLTTANGFDVDGTVAGSPELIAAAEALNATAKGSNVTTGIGSISIRAAPSITGCLS